MKRPLLFLVLFLFSGCSTNQILLTEKTDEVTIVKYTPNTKEHRAYFTRNDLLMVKDKKKYLFLYHPKYQNLYILLKKKEHYLLYNLGVPNKKPQKFSASSIEEVLQILTKSGYTHPKEIESLGFIVRTRLRRYNGVKTIMVDVKDYRPLKKKYENAIRTFDASKLSGINNSLPKKMILPYFTKYYNRARTPEQKSELRKIAKKLKLGITVTKKPDEPDIIQPLFPYYLQQASSSELEEYLQSEKSKKALTSGERSLLEHRLDKMKKKKLLEEAPLETLIELYKQNQDPEFKKHILSRIKELRSQ